jgi:hypothetical protein
MARHAFAVTDALREKVRYLAGVGVRQDDIAKIVGCTPKTLRKRLRDELDRGVAEANATISGYLFAAAKAGNIAAIIFWLKTRAHWREKAAPEEPGSDADTGSRSQVVLFLPDNSRDHELTQVLRDAQEKYFAKKPGQQAPELGTDWKADRCEAKPSGALFAMAGVNRSPAVKAGWSRRTARDGRRVRQHRSRGSPDLRRIFSAPLPIFASTAMRRGAARRSG